MVELSQKNNLAKPDVFCVYVKQFKVQLFTFSSLKCRPTPLLLRRLNAPFTPNTSLNGSTSWDNHRGRRTTTAVKTKMRQVWLKCMSRCGPNGSARSRSVTNATGRDRRRRQPTSRHLHRVIPAHYRQLPIVTSPPATPYVRFTLIICNKHWFIGRFKKEKYDLDRSITREYEIDWDNKTLVVLLFWRACLYGMD